MQNTKVNINKASREKLARIGGIGSGLADELIRYRERHGGFKDSNEIDQVNGFDEVIAEKVKEHIFIE